MQINMNEMKKQILKIRVNCLCEMLPEIARAVGTYNTALKAQGIDRKTRSECIKTLSDNLLRLPTEQPKENEYD